VFSSVSDTGSSNTFLLFSSPPNSSSGPSDNDQAEVLPSTPIVIKSPISTELHGVCDESTEEPVTKRPKFIKTEDDTIPLKDPFPLPKYYRGEVEKALSARKKLCHHFFLQWLPLC
jgi:hypothetical protein